MGVLQMFVLKGPNLARSWTADDSTGRFSTQVFRRRREPITIGTRNLMFPVNT